jgi:serine phosphatase RsbU (regulator of sigma subunit)
MKFNLRFKLFLSFMALNFVVSCLLGFFMYKTAGDRYFDNFRQHKATIARFISTAIDGNVHETLISPETSKDPRFWQYIRLISSIWKQEKEIRYIYTLNYNRKRDRLYYVLDGNIPEQDLMWLETPYFAFDMFFDKDGRMTVEYNYTFMKEDFDINTDIGKIRIGLADRKDGRRLLVQGQPVFTVRSVDPLSVETPAGIVTRNDRVKSGTIALHGKTMTCNITYSGKGEPSSYPGNDFIEKKELVKKIKEMIRNKQNYVDPEPIRNAYGEFISAYSTILNGRGDGIGMVVVDINSRDIAVFKRSILLVAVGVFIVTFLISTAFTVYISRHFTLPLAKLMEGVKVLASGDMTARVNVRSGDEFGALADNFNSMVKNLHAASEEQKRLIHEVSQLNETLEQRVIDRTLTIQAQSEELNRQIMMARRIQMSLLPVRLPDIQTITLSFKYQPMMAVGGDFIDFYYNNREMILFICDVSGHGVPAAFLSAMVKMSLPACYSAGRNTSLAMEKLHQSLLGKMGGHFISAIFCHIDLTTGTMVSSNAGHPPIIIVRKSGDIEFVGSQGRIISEKFPLNPMTVITPLSEGDKVILYTDGITEARNRDLVMFGEENLIQIIRKHRLRSSTELCEEIYRMIINYIGTTSPEFEDDITLLVSEYNG